MFKCPNCFKVSSDAFCTTCGIDMHPAHLCEMCHTYYVTHETFCNECIESIRHRFIKLNTFNDTELTIIFSVLNSTLEVDKHSVNNWIKSRHYEECYIYSLVNRFINFMNTNFRPDEIDYIME